MAEKSQHGAKTLGLVIVEVIMRQFLLLIEGHKDFHNFDEIKLEILHKIKF